MCCEYLCNCLLSSPSPKISGSPILEKLLDIAQKDDIYLKKILDICKECIKKNDKALLSYSILFEIMDKINRETNECIQNLIKDQYLLHSFEDNFTLYIKQAKEMMEKNNIPSTDGKSRDKYVINGFSHSENINKRIETLGHLVKYIYRDFDYISGVFKNFEDDDNKYFENILSNFKISLNSDGSFENLDLLGRNINNIIFIDNAKNLTKINNNDNIIYIKPYYGNVKDDKNIMYNLIDILKTIRIDLDKYDDIRIVLKRYKFIIFTKVTNILI